VVYCTILHFRVCHLYFHYFSLDQQNEVSCENILKITFLTFQSFFFVTNYLRYDNKEGADLTTWPTKLRLHVINSIGTNEKIFRHCFSFTILPCQMALVMCAHIAGNYATIRLFHASSIFIYTTWPLAVVITTVFEAVAYTIGAQVFHVSKEQIFSSKRIKGKKLALTKRQYNAIRPSRIQVGSFFPVDKSTLFNFWLIAMENTITVLFI